MEWEPTVDSTIVHGFIEPESVNGTDYESGDSPLMRPKMVQARVPYWLLKGLRMKLSRFLEQ